MYTLIHALMHAGTPARRHAGTPARRHAGTPARRHAALGWETGHNRTFQKHSKTVGLYGMQYGQQTLALIRNVYAALGWELQRRTA